MLVFQRNLQYMLIPRHGYSYSGSTCMIFQVRIIPTKLMEIQNQITTHTHNHVIQLPPTIWLNFKLTPWYYGITFNKLRITAWRPRAQHTAQAREAREATGRGGTVTYTAADDHESAQRSTSVLEVKSVGWCAPLYTCKVEGKVAYVNVNTYNRMVIIMYSI